MPGFVHVLDPYHGVARGWDDAATSLRYLEEVMQLEGSHSIAAFILETVTGTNAADPELDSVMLVPPVGATPSSDTVPVTLPEPPTTEGALSVNAVRDGGFTVRL